MEYISKMTMFGLERTVKSGQEKFILKFHHVQNYFPSICKMEKFCHETQICSAISLHFCTTYTTYTVTLRFLLYVLVLLYVLFEIFCLIFTYMYRMMAIFCFLLHEKPKIWKMFLSFQIYVLVNIHFLLRNLAGS